MKREAFACPQCKYSCTQASSLKRHKLIHSDEKPFTCLHCKYSCNRAGNLKKHLVIHSGENPIKSRKCNYSFCCCWFFFFTEYTFILKRKRTTKHIRLHLSTMFFVVDLLINPHKKQAAKLERHEKQVMKVGHCNLNHKLLRSSS